MVNTVSNREADFQVVGLVSPLTGEGGVYGLAGPMANRWSQPDPEDEEITWAGEEFWGVHFPPPDPEGAADAVATIECRSCHTLAEANLTLVEADVIETAGMLSLPCEVCNRLTPWGLAKKTPVATDTPPEPGIEQTPMSRRHTRVSLKLPALIRRYTGEVEITHTDDVSKGGFAFTSEKDYYVGEGLMVACPYSGGDRNIEVQGQIARRQAIPGTENKAYGVKYPGSEP